MKIIVICGAGASSTFVATRLRRAAASAHIDIDASAASLAGSDAAMDIADAVLIGSHLGTALDDVRARARAHGIPAAVLPDDIANDREGTTALAIVRDLTTRIP